MLCSFLFTTGVVFISHNSYHARIDIVMENSWLKRSFTSTGLAVITNFAGISEPAFDRRNYRIHKFI